MKAELILALDLTDKTKAIEIAKEVEDYISAIKVNYPLVLSAGIDVIKELAKIKPVVADFKIADIPYTSSLIAELAFKNSASAVIVHGFAGRETVKAVLEVAKNYDGEVYVVTELTSSDEFFRGVANAIAKMAVELGCHGIIAPANKPERVKELKAIVGDLKVICPGVGVQGGGLDVVKYGATHVIVGRTIYTSKNPKKTAEEIYKALKSL